MWLSMIGCVHQTDPRPAPVEVAPEATDARPTATLDGVTEGPPNHFTVPAAALAPYQEGEAAARLARAVPHRDLDGRADGIRLLAIRSGTVLDQLGLENGDLAQAIRPSGGPAAPLLTIEDAIAAWDVLWTAPSFCVDLDRSGEPVTLCYEIVGRSDGR